MARRPGWSRSFKKDSKLQQYFLDQVMPTGKTLGTGSYGSVLEVSKAASLKAYKSSIFEKYKCNLLVNF